MGQQQLFTINGLVDTNKTVWQNLEELAGASAAYVTWDPYTFKYGVVINQPGNSIRSFNDDNIIGAISITETPFDELYNSAEIRFPNKDIRDKTDTIRYDQPAADRFDSEPDNKLSIQFDFVNDPIQADVIARTELKQSRFGRTISFTTDFQQLDMAPGDIIDLTNPYWGWDAKLFRIVEITQTDTVQGEIFVDIVAVEYDVDVYNYNDLTRLERTVSTGVPAVKNNTAVQTKSDQDLGTQVGRAVATDEGAAGLASQGYPTVDTLVQEATSAGLEAAFNASTPFTYQATLAVDGRFLNISGGVPFGQVVYSTNFGGSTYNIQNTFYIPLLYRLSYTPPGGSPTLIQEEYKNAGESNFSFYINNPAAGSYELSLSATVGSEIPVPYDPTQTGTNLGTIGGVANVYSGGDAIITPLYFESIGPGPSSSYGNRVQWTLFF